jgi:hypothetical protein
MEGQDGMDILFRIAGSACVALALLATTDCTTAPTDRPGKTVHYIQIRDSIDPSQVYASVGDEIRWQNLRPEAVKVGILDARGLDQASCADGFRRFGQVEDSVTIDPRESASLCFAKPTVIRYNVWLDANDPRSSMTRTSTVWIRDPRH